MPKLLQINIAANWGSTGKIAESIGLAAMANGWDSYIAHGSIYNPSNSHLIEVGGKQNRYLHYAEQRVFDNEGLCSRRETKRLIERIDELKPDVIHLHNIHDHYLNYRLLFEYLNVHNIHVVWTLHDCWPLTGHCMHFVTKNCERWKTGCYDCLMKGEYPKTLLDRSRANWQLKKKLFGNCANLTVVACSEWIAGFVRESFLNGKSLSVIHNGIDLHTFTPACGSKDNRRFVVLAVSNIWTHDKGEQDIYRLREVLPAENYDIVMVGLSQKQLRVLPSGITGLQRTKNVEELVRMYSDADVLINPTYADTFPTVNLEALACGTPVITYNTGGSPEAVDENTGVVVEQGNVEALADAIRRMRLNPLSPEACRKRAEELFDKDKCFGKYIELYDRLMKKDNE